MEELECGLEELYPIIGSGKVPQVGSDIRTFYAVHWWLADESDVREIDGINTLGEALKKAKELRDSGQGYHEFAIYAYHARLVNEPFWHEGQLHPYEHWEKIDDGFEAVWDISGKKEV